MKFFLALLQHRLLVMLFAVVLVAAGLVAWRNLPIDAFPDVTNTQVMILSKAPGLAATDVEDQISYPIEQVMRGLPRVMQVRSLSKAGLSQVVIIFEDGADVYWTRQQVFERLSLAKDQLPLGVEPELGPLSTGLGEIFQYTLEGDSIDAMELRTIQDWLVAPLLKPVAGVNEVNSFGGYVRQVQVLVSPEKLLKYNLTLEDVAEALERSNSNAGGGVIVNGWEQMYMRGVGLLESPEDIEEVVLRAVDGSPVLVSDIADVVIGSETRQGAVTRDGNGEAVAGMIIMLKGANAREVVDRVKEAIGKIKGNLPDGVRLNVFYDRTDLIQACIRTVQNVLLQGGLFVILVLFLFLAELRSALIVVLALPLTFLISFIVMGWVDLSSNLMSLGGLAFSVGMVVDASIVVVENVRRHLANARPDDPKREVIARGVAEVARPVAFSVAIVAIILVPLFTLQGIEGKMFAPLATTMLIALLVSLVVAFTIIPSLADTLLTKRPLHVFGFTRRLHAAYLRQLDRVLRRPRLTIGVAVGILLASLSLVPFIGTEFMPPLDEGAIAINVVRLPNASLEGAVQVSTIIERRLATYSEVEAVVSKTGRAEISEDPMGPEQTDIIIMLKPKNEWTTGREKTELVAAIQADLTTIPGLRFSFSQPIALRVNELISGVKSDLAVKIFGPDLTLLKEYSDQVAGILQEVEGAVDVKVEQISGMEQLDVRVDRKALARYGISMADFNSTIELAVAGQRVTTLIEQQRRTAVVLRFPERDRATQLELEHLLVPAPGGERVPLSQLAEFKLVETPMQVSRENGMRRVVAETNVRGRDLGSFVAEVQERLASLENALPTGYHLEYGGQFENQQRAMRQLLLVVPIALLLILVLLFIALESFGSSLLVLLNLPFALVGGVLAVVVFQMPLSVSAAVAFIVLLGVAVQNGVVLVSFFRQLRKEGRSVEETVRIGCDLRFRPLLMTALTSFIGHLPMLYAAGAGADIQKPLAAVVMGGLITSSVLTLFVLPTLYLTTERWLEKRKQNAMARVDLNRPLGAGFAPVNQGS